MSVSLLSRIAHNGCLLCQIQDVISTKTLWGMERIALHNKCINVIS